MRLRTNIFRRDGIFYHRQVSPKELLAIIRRRELKISLRTGCPSTASLRGAKAQLGAEKLFAYLRGAPNLLNHQVQAAIRTYYHSCLEEDEADRLSGARRDELIEASHREAFDEVAKELGEQLNKSDFSNAEGWIRTNPALNVLPEANSSHPLHGRLCQGVLRATLEVFNRVTERDNHNWGGVAADPLLISTPIPVSAPVVSCSTPGSATGLSMEELIDRFFDLRKPKKGGTPKAKKTEQEFRTSLEWFRDYFGGYKSPDAYTKKDFLAYKSALVKVPRNFRKVLKVNTVVEAIERNKIVNKPTIDTGTINNKRLGNLDTFFTWLEQDDYISKNYAHGVRHREPGKKKRRKRKPFEITQLNSIFQSAEWSKTRDSEPHKYWLPLLALYTGARVGELAQLNCTDVIVRDGVLTIRISEGTDPSNPAEYEKDVKNDDSERDVPVHPAILALGFQKFVESVRAEKHVRLFPSCLRGKADGGWSPYSKYFARFLTKINVKERGLVFHSFRHTFEDAMRRARIEEEIRFRLAGRADRHSSASYGSGHDFKDLFSEMAKISYPGLKISAGANVPPSNAQLSHKIEQNGSRI